MKIKIITSIVIEKDGKFLIMKRAPHDTMPGLWEFPGGKVDAEEKLIDSAKREVKEESGLIPNKLEYKGYTERFSEDRNVKSGYHTIVHHFYCNDFNGEIKVSEEHTEFKWVTKSEILKMKVGKEVGNDTVEFFKL